MFRTRYASITPPRLMRLVVTLSLIGLLSACGAGGSSGQDLAGGFYVDGRPTIEITTQSVPAGKPGVAYNPTQLTTSGAQGPVVWTIAGGSLPPGIRLTDDGRVTGVPAEPGFYEFTAEASDGTGADQQSFGIAIDVFGAAITDGLYCGDAWTGAPVSLRTAGAAGGTRFDAVVNESGGRLQQIDATAGTAVWLPGPNAGTDRVRVTDVAGGEVIELDIPVVVNPAASHVARFGTTDVWYLDWQAKAGRHPYASDFHAGLAYLGLRARNSTDDGGTEADRLVDLVVRVRVLRELNRMYLRNPDGTEGARGLAISFPLERPGDGYVAPGAGGYMNRVANGYSVMALCDQSGAIGAQGVAYQDGLSNGRLEHNAPGGPGGELGVFVNMVAGTVDRAYRLYGDELKTSPVSDEDLPALKALLYDRPSPGGRHDMLAYQVNAFARSLAFVAAHEIGHSVGCPHLFAYTTGAIMNSSLLIGPGAEYFFVEETLGVLRTSLGTSAGGTAAAVAAGPSHGVHVCGACAGH
ncbi:MAG: putative Ig domain-containing protein [Planctomycetota bacterium]|nr:putative Ig domain-containing protein [Planctomycetota bacterium]